MFPALKYRPFLFLLLLFVFGNLQAQTEADIERLKKRAAELSSKISDTDKKASLLRRQLNLSESRVALLNGRISKTESLIAEQERELERLDAEKENLLKLAEQLLVYAYKTRNTRSKAAFLFSADDFSQAYKRFLYVRFYTNVLNRKIDAINDTRAELQRKAAELSENKNTLYKLAEQKTDELLAHKQNITELNRIKRQLRQNSSRIRKEISDKQKILDRLNTAVSDEILVGNQSNPQSADFLSSKGKLPFPMRGVITQKFGNHRHEVLENVTITSNGIELSGKVNAPVHAVFPGTVLRISNIPGSNLAVIIQHGNYYTVYSNLKQCSVKQGQSVTAQQKIAICAESSSDASHSELYFQLWLNKTKLDPEQWLKKP
jgi:septal ring factor EnvC (AmiA/AmiB activator)